MKSFEDEFRKIEPVVQRLIQGALLWKKIEIKGEENLVRHGPNIIVGNHIGSYKDVAILFKIVPRLIFFTANKEIFTKKEFSDLILKHLQRHLRKFGLFVNLLLNPLKSLFVEYISSNIARIGTIPVDLYLGRREALKKCEEYLREGRTIITLQGRGRVNPKGPNPYVPPFKKGSSIMVYNLHVEEGMNVPVTPLAIFGTQIPFLIPGKISVNVGKSMYITDYLADEANESIERFRDALETRVKGLFQELLKA